MTTKRAKLDTPITSKHVTSDRQRYQDQDYKNDWHPWHADEPWNPIPPHLRQGCFLGSKWEIPNYSWGADDMQSALGGHLRDLQEKKHSILKRIEERDPGRDFEFDQPEEYHDYCPDELRHWTLWKADEDWNPIPPSWRLWPIGRGKKEEVARILHEVHEEIRLAKQRLREMETSDSDLTDHT